MDAKCTAGAEYRIGFEQYISQCRSAADTRVADQFFSNSKEQLKKTFQDLRDQYTDLMVMGDSMVSIANLSGNSVGGVNTRLNELTKKKDMLQAEANHYKRLADASDKGFLDDIMHGTPKEELAPSLQDASLLLFCVGWLFISITLVLVRWGSPGGGWRSGLFTLVLMLLVTVCLYGLLKQVA